MGYFCLPRENTLHDYIETAQCNLRLFNPGFDYLLDFAKYDLQRAIDIMKQQLLEEKLRLIAAELNLAKACLELVGKYDDTEHIVKAASNHIQNALDIYDSKDLSTPSISDREISED